MGIKLNPILVPVDKSGSVTLKYLFLIYLSSAGWENTPQSVYYLTRAPLNFNFYAYRGFFN